MKLQTVDELFFTGLKYAYDAEKQLTEALPKMAEFAANPELKQAFEMHLGETKEHVARAEQIFRICGKQPEVKTNSVLKQMTQEAEQMVSSTEKGPIRDAALIVAGNQVEHFEMASYGSLRTFAQLLNKTEVVALLEQTLREEKQADAKLTEIGEQSVNIQAVHQSAAAVGAR